MLCVKAGVVSLIKRNFDGALIVFKNSGWFDGLVGINVKKQQFDPFNLLQRVPKRLVFGLGGG